MKTALLQPNFPPEIGASPRANEPAPLPDGLFQPSPGHILNDTVVISYLKNTMSVVEHFFAKLLGTISLTNCPVVFSDYQFYYYNKGNYVYKAFLS